MEVNLKEYQKKFVLSKKKFPAMVGGWGTGKTLCLIARAMIYSELIPGNQGMILRHQYTDLRDSTIKDFERYTGMKINSQREAVFGNGSSILFRCMDEFKTQNINLSWAAIEQAEELPTDDDFLTLFGRFRREVKPSEAFLKLGLPERSCWIIANAGDNWVKNLWKDEPAEGFDLIECVTMDNKDNLPKDFIESLEVLRIKKPLLYRRYVENDWTVTSDQMVLIPPKVINDCKDLDLHIPRLSKHIVSCDPSLGGDLCPVYYIRDNRIMDKMVLNLRDTMKITGELLFFGRKHNCDEYAIDTIGIGKGIVDRLVEIVGHKKVHAINSAETAFDEKQYVNRRAEMWGYVSNQFIDRKLPYPFIYKQVNKDGNIYYEVAEKDDDLTKQLTNVRFKILNSSGKMQLESKSDLKQAKRLGRSPDEADTYIYGIWALKDVKAEEQHKVEPFRMSKNRKEVKSYHGTKKGW